MQILYFWIDDGDKFKGSGFNFSPEYRIDMKKDASGKYKLFCFSLGSYNIMNCSYGSQNNVSGVQIENVTALVGDNGSGKTSIMRELIWRRCDPRKETPKKTKRLYVIKDGAVIFAETNLLQSELDYDSDSDIKIWSADFDVEEDGKKEDDKIEDDCKKIESDNASGLLEKGVTDFTSIYMTNVSYSSFKISPIKNKGIDRLVFSPQSMTGMVSDFFKFIFRGANEKAISVPREMYAASLAGIRDNMAFQQYCDILYFHSLLKGKAGAGSNCGMKKIPDYLTVSAQPASNCMDIIREQAYFVGEEMLNHFTFLSKQAFKMGVNKEHQPEILTILKRNMVFEWLVMDLKTGKDGLDMDPGSVYADGYYKVLKGYLYNVSQREQDGDEVDSETRLAIKYFTNAAMEIDSLEKIIKPTFDDKTKQNEIKLYGESRDKFIEFCQERVLYNNTTMKSQDNFAGSFVMRYLQIGNLAVSSGERAFRNIMSWMNYAAHLEDYSSSKDSYLKDNVILCIDEIDALCHPEWQRDILGNVIQALSEEYDGVNIQLFISTHSPLCLSNIPRENILFLENHGDIGIIDKGNDHISQTFGSNIYDILNESFFLKGKSIGIFAERYIKDLIESIGKVNPGDFEHTEKIAEKIGFVGDQFIRNKLTEQLYRKLYNGDEKNKRRVAELNRRKKYIEDELEKLKAGE